MPWSARSLGFACILAVAGGLLYLTGLSWSPAYLSIEEVGQGQQVEALATTGRSLSGQRWPLYVAEPGYQAGREPLWIYASVLLLKLTPFSEAVLRLPSAIAGVIDILLMFVLARRVFRSDAVGLVAAGLLGLTPAHFLHSRLATSQIGPVPFVLFWLICLVRYLETGRARDLFLSTIGLGLGVYAYLSAVVMLPVFFLATLATIVQFHRGAGLTADVTSRASRDFWIACGGLAVSLAPSMVWNVLHPGRLGSLVDYYTHNGYNVGIASENHFMRELVTRLDLWWNCFNPERVFFSADSSLRYSTRTLGHLLLPTAVLIAVGARYLWQTLPPGLPPLVLVGVLFGPLPALLGGEFEVKRWLSILPFVVLVMACCVKRAFDSRQSFWWAATVALLALSLFQFGRFLQDYRGDYRGRSAYYFGGNLRGSIEHVLATAPEPACVFLDGRIGIAPYWAFYTRVYGRPDFAEQATLLKPEEFSMDVPAHCQDATFLVVDKAVGSVDGFGWTKTTIPEIDGGVMLSVYRHVSHETPR